MITIKEMIAFNQVITAVLDKNKILDIRKGHLTDHATQAARFHATKQQQATIMVYPVYDRRYKIATAAI